jgi:transposase-like protein
LYSFTYPSARTGRRAWTRPDSRINQEIAAQATVEQLLNLESRTAHLLAERAAEALVARRASSVDACPHCAGTRIVRHGRDGGGRQRFRCLGTDGSPGCGRAFNGLTGTAFARMRKPELWSGYARLLASGTSLSRIVARADMAISRFTAWRWRRRGRSASAESSRWTRRSS